MKDLKTDIVIEGDCLEELKKLPTASVDLVFDHDRDTLWQYSFEALGIDPGFFAGTTGSA